MSGEILYTDDGVPRILNLQPSDPAKVERLVSAGVGDVIPSSEIVDFELWPDEVGDKNQGSAGACNGHAASTAAEFGRAMQGLAYVPLSAWWVYGRLVFGRDRGSNIMDALELCKTQGVAPEADVRYGDFSGDYSAQAAANAKRFRIEIGAGIGQDYDALLSEVARLKGVNASVCANVGWTSGNGNLNSEGVPPVGRGACNHAVFIGGGIKTLKDGRRAVLCQNSWSKQWGRNGRCWLTADHIMLPSWFEAYSVKALAPDLQDIFPTIA